MPTSIRSNKKDKSSLNINRFILVTNINMNVMTKNVKMFEINREYEEKTFYLRLLKIKTSRQNNVRMSEQADGLNTIDTAADVVDQSN